MLVASSREQIGSAVTVVLQTHCCAHFEIRAQKYVKSVSMSICSQCKSITGCLQKMSTKGHKREGKAFGLDMDSCS